MTTARQLGQASFKAGVVLLLLVAVYAMAFRRASNQVDAFCARVSTDTAVSALPDIAKAVGVKLVGPGVVEVRGVSRVSARVVNPLTMGDYGCVVDAASMTGKVESKQLGYH